MPPGDHLIDDILGGGLDPLESDQIPGVRAIRREAKRRFLRQAQREHLRDVLPEPPAPGEAVYILSAAQFDFWTFVPELIAAIGSTRALYCSTWTTSRTAVVELLELIDAGTIGRAHFLTGLYFKRRETAVYAELLQGLRVRGGQYRAFRNHTKIILLDNPDRDAWLSVTGSANLTANPRAEQYTIDNHRPTWEFYRDWFEEMLATVDPEPDA